MDLFTTFDVEKILAIKRTRLQEWLNQEFIRASQQTPALGIKALFSREDLYGIKLFEELIKRGHSRKRASRIIDRVLGWPVQLYYKPVNWESDYLNIFELSPDEESKKEQIKSYRKHGLEPDEMFGFLISYGEPEIPKYKNIKHPTFITTNIYLGTIKKMVDRKIG